jgi:hypothetical protein
MLSLSTQQQNIQLRKLQGASTVFRLRDCWLLVGMQPVGPETGLVVIRLFGFLVSWCGSKIPGKYYIFLKKNFLFKLIKIKPFALGAAKLSLQIT